MKLFGYNVLIIVILCSVAICGQNYSYTSTTLIKNTNPNYLSFAGKTYYFDTVFRANYYKSMQYCRQQGMHLVSIANEIENNKISKYIVENGWSDYHFWTSATNLADGEWIWMSTGRNLGYTNWQRGEPNALNSSENCLEVRQWGNDGFTWNDLPCAANLYFICESVNDCRGNKKRR